MTTIIDPVAIEQRIISAHANLKSAQKDRNPLLEAFWEGSVEYLEGLKRELEGSGSKKPN